MFLKLVILFLRIQDPKITVFSWSELYQASYTEQAFLSMLHSPIFTKYASFTQYASQCKHMLQSECLIQYVLLYKIECLTFQLI